MHRYLLSGMFGGVLLFFMAVSAVPTQATQPINPPETHKFYRSTPAHAPVTLVSATASAKTISVMPSPTNISPKSIASSPSKTQSTTSPAATSTTTTSIVPTVQPTPTPTPTSGSQSTASTNSQDSFITAINQYRASQGLGPVQSDTNTCNFAKTRAGEITSNFSHDGFTSRMNSHTLPYPSYHEVTENIAMTSDPSQVVPMWIASPGHAENMRRDTPFVCVEQSGNYFAYEGWKP